MEVILDCFFEHFEKLDRDTLHARYKRREMVEYFNTMIEGCCRGEEALIFISIYTHLKGD